MLTDEQIENFCKATAVYNCGDLEAYEDVEDRVCEPDDVARTRDTVQGFKEGLGNGEPDEIVKTPAGDLLVWYNLQLAKGCCRGDLFVMDFGDARAAYFDGETPNFD